MQQRPEWIDPEPPPATSSPYHPDPLIHAILARRVHDAEEAAEFLDARERAAPDPAQLPGMPEAVERVAAALHRGEAIGIFGDYDTDGVTSAALLSHALRTASGGAQPAAVRLPRRQEGYGLSAVGVADLARAGTRLLIAVDCGSKDHEAVASARRQGLDVVILDHHKITSDVPAGALVASAQLREGAPYREVSAAGLAYLLATALAERGFDTGGGPGQEPTSLLDLAMIGLVGDVAPLAGVNRPLVRDGLRRLRENPRPGLLALCELGGINGSTLTSTDVAFLISPRLNAPGRLDDPRPAYELLVARDRGMALKAAEQAETANRRRKLLQDRVLSEVEEKIAKDRGLLDRRVLVVAGRDWGAGIVGLAAGKLAERYGRPAVVLSISDGVARGSARSVPGFDIAAALAAHEQLLLRHGGHERAAGLTLPVENILAIEDALQTAIASSAAEPPGPRRLAIDAEIPAERLRVDVARLIQSLGPFGEANPVPILRASRVPIRGYAVMGRENQHLKILTAGPAGMVDAVLWNGAVRSRELVGMRAVDVVGALEINAWNGSVRPQLKVADFRAADD